MDRWGSQYPEDLHLIEDLGLLILGTKKKHGKQYPTPKTNMTNMKNTNMFFV